MFFMRTLSDFPHTYVKGTGLHRSLILGVVSTDSVGSVGDSKSALVQCLGRLTV